MATVVVASPKGGAGKSTAAVLLGQRGVQQGVLIEEAWALYKKAQMV